jgi:RNA polymerase sigma-70 factor (ECF subfamily)
MIDNVTILIKGIYDAFFDQIYRYCTYRLYSKDLAEDATSAVFTKLVQRFPEIRHKSMPEIRQWLFGVASNVVTAQRRLKKRQQEAFHELSQTSGSGLAGNEPRFHRLDWPVLYGAISRLPDKQQDIVILRFFHELETAQIAEIVGMSPVAVRVTLMRTIRKLKEQLQESFEGL